ncbi:MAG: HD domain-containing protein, partial [Candidatus Omnitrophica bacterium]|nr:HD domain-containing protein [Candidatus Omnitrophota bacterium]
MRAAVIDIGSNSIKLLIGEKIDDEIKILETLKSVVGIGRSTFYKGRISQEIFNEIVEILKKYNRLIQQYEISDVRIIATTAVREAENRNVFIDTIRRKTGFDIEILNVGDVVYFIDAFLSYKLTKKYPINQKNLLIAELGAGSLDVSIMEKGYALYNLGVPIGTLRLKQFKNLIDTSQKMLYETLEEYVENQIEHLKRITSGTKLDDIILIDDSYSDVVQRVLPNTKREEGFFLFHFRESKQLLTRLTGRNTDDLAEKYDLPMDVSDTMDSYSVIINKLFKLIKKRSIYILETSLAEALLFNILHGFDLADKYNKSNQLVSVAKFICQKYGSDLKHTKNVAFLCKQLFDGMKDILGVNEDDFLYLLLAAYLHDVGLFINNRAHHKHTEYIISSLSLFRLTSREIKCIACIARYHRKAHPQKTHFLYGSLAPDEQLLVQKLSSILRIANALDSSHKQKVKKLEIQMNKNGTVSLIAYVTDDLTLEK